MTEEQRKAKRLISPSWLNSTCSLHTHKFCCQTALTPAIPWRSWRIFIPWGQPYMQTQPLPVSAHLSTRKALPKKEIFLAEWSSSGHMLWKSRTELQNKLLVFNYAFYRSLPQYTLSKSYKKKALYAETEVMLKLFVGNVQVHILYLAELL